MRPVRSLTYGITSTLTLVDADGQPLVLRTYDPTQHPVAEDGAVEHEVHALAAAQRVLGDLVPELVAADPSGADAGCPSLLMTYLPGRVVIADIDHVQLAATIAQLHAAAVPAELPEGTLWFHRDRLDVPVWTDHAASWKQLIALLRGPAPAGTSVFLHHDFHHGNVLWSGERISGVVDWPSASRGPRSIDVAHTRANLALVNGVDVSDRFLAAYAERVPGYVHDTWHDAAALVGHVQEGFAGLLAFRAFGAALGAEVLAASADRFARALAETT